MGVFFSLPLCFAKREAWGTLRFPQHKNSSKAAQVPVPSYSKYSWGTHFTPDCPLSHSLSTFPQRFIQPAAKHHLPPPRGVRSGGRVLDCACTCFRARPRARAFRHEWLSGARGRGQAGEPKIAAEVGGDVKRQRRTSVRTTSAGGNTRSSLAWCGAVVCCSERSVTSTPSACARPGASNPTWGCRFFAFLLPQVFLPGGLFLAIFLSPFRLWRTRAWPVMRRAWSPIFVRKVVWNRVWDFSGDSVHVRWRAGILACRLGTLCGIGGV